MENAIPDEIPFVDLFMMCPKLNRKAFAQLPQGFHFRMCRPDELNVWKEMSLDSPYTPETYAEYMQVMNDYYDRVYAGKKELFFQKCLFVCDSNKPVGRGFVWKAYDKINTVHWFKVLKDYTNRGIGRAILTKILGDLNEADFPVFLHTHPTAYRAIKLYSDFGFCLVSDPVVGYRNNGLEESFPALQKIMPEKDFRNLRIVRAPQYFLDAAASSKSEEF